MNPIHPAAGRRPPRAAVLATVALLALPASLLSRGHRARSQTPLAAAATPAAPARAGGEAQSLLAAVRGIDPVACELVLQSAGSHWGWSAGDAEDGPALARASETTLQVLAWLGERPATAEDAATLDQGLGDPDPCVRRLAARLLAHDDVPGGRDLLLTALRSADAPRREAAILGLGYAGEARAVPALVGLLRDGDAEVRAGAAWALGHTESHDAAVAVARLTDDREPRVRRAVARALGRLEDASSIPALAALLTGDPDPGVRRAAAWALGKIE